MTLSLWSIIDKEAENNNNFKQAGAELGQAQYKIG